MQVVQGKTVFQGIAVGPICVYIKRESALPCHSIERAEAEQEIERYRAARQRAVGRLGELKAKALTELGEDSAQLFEAHAMMLTDQDFVESIESLIKDGLNCAEQAVKKTRDLFAAQFAAMEDEYFRARAADIEDISARLTAELTGSAEAFELEEPCILLAENLAPSETVRLDLQKLLGLATRQGSLNSHTAILARTMNVPALIGIELDEDWQGKTGILDGFAGRLIVEPDVETLSTYRSRRAALETERRELWQLRGQEDVSFDGRAIRLFANIARPQDLTRVREYDARGIGLFRSEFLYLDADTFPDEETQFHAYKEALQAMEGKPVIIRTLDIGADKKVGYFGLAEEENPALGYRAIRICLTRPEIFRTQLRAMIRAGAFGNLAIMYPMIISVDEVRRAKALAAEVKAELVREGRDCGDFRQGIMIETPAAVMISDLLAQEVDFFSIGTNDLSQYTLAIDRQNSELDAFYQPNHPAVLRMIRMTVENAHKAGIWCGICGELAADTSLTRTFMEMGIDELSVAPPMVLPVRKALLAR